MIEKGDLDMLLFVLVYARNFCADQSINHLVNPSILHHASINLGNKMIGHRNHAYMQ